MSEYLCPHVLPRDHLGLIPGGFLYLTFHLESVTGPFLTHLLPRVVSLILQSFTILSGLSSANIVISSPFIKPFLEYPHLNVPPVS